jgi:4-hydroxybenzoyl-CoA thioesterase/acyl-CoA thioester hydrolase
MAKSYRTSRRIEFADTDAAGIAHFTVCLRLMEEAEHEFLRHVGLSVLLSDEDGPISFPRVRVTCDYRRSVKFEDVVDIDVSVVRVGRSAIAYRFLLSLAGDPVAEGELTAVCCRIGPGQRARSIATPEWIASKLREYATEDVS